MTLENLKYSILVATAFAICIFGFIIVGMFAEDGFAESSNITSWALAFVISDAFWIAIFTIMIIRFAIDTMLCDHFSEHGRRHAYLRLE